MTTLTDIDILMKCAEAHAENYNRRCRRLVALLRYGCKVDAKTWDATDNLRACMENSRRDLEDAILSQSMAASV